MGADQNVYGASGGAVVDDNGYCAALFGFESDTLILGTGTTPIRIGINSANQGEKRATQLDAAYGVGSNGLRAVYDGSFGDLFLLYNLTGINPAGQELPAALAPTASFFRSDHALPVAHFANLPNVSFSGNIFHFPKLRASGEGWLSLGPYSSSLAGSAWLHTAPSTAARASLHLEPGAEVDSSVRKPGDIFNIGMDLIFVDQQGARRPIAFKN